MCMADRFKNVKILCWLINCLHKQLLLSNKNIFNFFINLEIIKYKVDPNFCGYTKMDPTTLILYILSALWSLFLIFLFIDFLIIITNLLIYLIQKI